MRTTLLRAARVAGATALLATAGTLATTGSAHALTVGGDPDMRRTVVALDPAETAAAAVSKAAAQPFCDAATSRIDAAGLYLAPAARTNCANAVWQCAQWAVTYGHAFVGVKFQGDTGVPQCLRGEDLL